MSEFIHHELPLLVSANNLIMLTCPIGQVNIILKINGEGVWSAQSTPRLLSISFRYF